MSFIGKLMARAIRGAMSEAGWMALGNMGGGAASSVPGTNRPAENSTMVYGCLMARREAIGGVALRISDEDGNLVEKGPVAELLARPNLAMTWEDYIRAIETYSTLYDAIAILPVRDGSRIVELIPLHPGFLAPEMAVHDDSGTPVARAWRYRDPWTGAERTFDRSEIVVHHGFNPYAPLAALSPANVLRRTMAAELASREQNLSMFRNDATPPFVLTTDKPITKEQADQILDKWEATHAGFANRGRPGVLWGGLKADKLGLTPSEMEYLEGLKFLRTDYYMVFRVTPAMVMEMTGETGLSQGSSTDAQKAAWWENVGLPELDMIAGLHESILGRAEAGAPRKARAEETAAMCRAAARRGRSIAGGRLYLWADDNTIPALVRSRLAKLDQLDKLCRLGWKPEDAAAWLDLGLPPHPVNIGLVPIGVQPVTDLVGLPPAPAAAAEPQMPRALRILDGIREHMAGDDRLAAKWQGVRKRMDQMLKGLEREAARKWSRYFMEQRDRVLARVGARAAGVDDARAVREDLDAFVARVFPMSAENDEMVKRLAGVIEAEVQAGWSSINSEAGLAEGANPFTIDDPIVRAGIAGRKVQAAKANDTTAEDLRGILAEAIESGETLTSIGDRIAEYYRTAIGEGAARPMTAARTQVAGAVNDGRMAAAKAVGGLRKAWLHGGSAEPRSGHLDAQERYMAAPIGMDEKFRVNGFECDAPGDSALPVGEVANCTCMVVFVEA